MLEHEIDFEKMSNVTIRKFKKDDYLIREGEVVHFVYYLIKGIVHREVITSGGNQVTVTVITGENTQWDAVIGLLVGCVKESRIAEHSVFLAKTDCVCFQIPVTSIWEYLDHHPEQWRTIAKIAMREYREAGELLFIKSDGYTIQKLCQLLLENSVLKKHKQVVDTKLFSNIELAKQLCVHKVTVARMLKALKEDKLIEKERNYIEILDVDRLEECAEGLKKIKYY